MGNLQKRRQNSVTSLPELLGLGWRLDQCHISVHQVRGRTGWSRFAHLRDTVAATSGTATAGPTVFGDFMGLLCCPRAARWLGAMASFNVELAAFADQWTLRSDAAGEIRNSVWACIR
jgi:hypothetical protein